MIRHRRPTGHETVFEFDPAGYFGVTRPRFGTGQKLSCAAAGSRT